MTAEATTSEGIIALLWNGEELGLFYRTDTVIRLQRLTMLGDPIGEPISVNPTRRPRLGDAIKVVWSSALDAWVIGRHISSGSDRGIWVTTISTTGTEQMDEEIPAVPPIDPQLALAVTDTGTIGIFYLTTDDNTLVLSVIKPGKFPSTHSVSSTGYDVQATGAGDLFVVTRGVGESPTAAIRWFVVDTDHQFVRPDGQLLDGNGGFPVPLSLIYTGEELALTYSLPPGGSSAAPELRLHRFTIAGDFISDTRFTGLDSTSSRALTPFPLVWTGTAYVVAAVRETTTRLDSHLQRYCPLRSEIEAPRIVLAGQPVTFTAVTDGGVPGYSYAWTIVRDPGGSRTGATIERTFTLLGPRLVTMITTDATGATTTSSFTIDVVEEIVEPFKRRRAIRK
jgi:hypothetical protein